MEVLKQNIGPWLEFEVNLWQPVGNGSQMSHGQMSLTSDLTSLIEDACFSPTLPTKPLSHTNASHDDVAKLSLAYPPVPTGPSLKDRALAGFVRCSRISHQAARESHDSDFSREGF